jgi:hypothetical protein
MGLSFDDEASMLEAAGNFMYFAPEDPNATSEIGSISQDGSSFIASDPIPETRSMSEERREGGSIEIRIAER